MHEQKGLCTEEFVKKNKESSQLQSLKINCFMSIIPAVIIEMFFFLYSFAKKYFYLDKRLFNLIEQ